MVFTINQHDGGDKILLDYVEGWAMDKEDDTIAITFDKN